MQLFGNVLWTGQRDSTVFRTTALGESVTIGQEAMTEVLFYHLDNKPPETVLPALLARALERGFRVVVEAGSEERVEALDRHLWTYRDDSFLPHGTVQSEYASRQPIILTNNAANPNSANVRILLDRAPPPEDLSPYQRLLLLFEGSDSAALADARKFWQRAKVDGHTVTYWRQDDQGQWVREG